MEYHFSKFPVQKPYIKVESNRSSSHGSVGSPDDLTYSYSCINAFRKNRSIIKNLTSLRVNNHIQGEGHEPLLYSLSGDREKPICGPFYYSTAPEEAKNNNFYSTENLIKVDDPSSSNLESEYENIFSDKSALFDWLKDQVKYVNVLWSFSKSSYINLSKFCKCKNQEVKMEMLLNNIDEKTKTRLKYYLNELNLDLEERCTLFNESTIEINITPILADKSKFQAFLSFLKTIDPSTYNSVEGNVTKPFNQLPEGNEEKTSNKYTFARKEMKQDESSFRRNRGLRNSSADRTNRRMPVFLENKDKLSKDRIAKPTHTETVGPKLSHNYKGTSKMCKVRTNSLSKLPHGNSLISSFESGTMKPRTINNYQPLGNNDKLSRKPRGRFESTLVKQRSLNSLIDRKQTSRKLYDLMPSAIQQSKVSDTNCAQTDGKLSCKCLIHSRREDYNRYRNQCLFGKGDETSNNFIKYLADKERGSQCQVHMCSRNKEKGRGKAREMNHGENEPFDEFEDEHRVALRKTHKLKYENDNKNLKIPVAEDNKLKKAAEKDCTCISSQNNYYKTYDKIRVGDVEKLMYSINYNESNYNNGCFDNNLGLYRSKPTRMPVADEETSSFDACFESLSYDVAKREQSANLTCVKSKSDTNTNRNNVPCKLVPVGYDYMNSDTEPMENMKKEVNGDHQHCCHRIKPSGDQYHKTSCNFNLIGKNPSVQVLHCNNRLQNYSDKKLNPHNNSTNKYITNRSNYKVLPNNESNLKIKMRKSSQTLGSSCSYADKHSLQTDYSRMSLIDKTNVVIKINQTNDGEARPELKEIKSQRTHLSLNSLKPKNLYRNISTILKRKSSTNRCKSEQTKFLFSEHAQSHSKETELTQSLNSKQNNCCDSVSGSSEAKLEIPSILTELLDRLITELQNQRNEINKMKELLHDQKR